MPGDKWICPKCGLACSFMGDVCKHWLDACYEKLQQIKLDEELYGPEIDELELAQEYWG